MVRQSPTVLSLERRRQERLESKPAWNTYVEPVWGQEGERRGGEEKEQFKVFQV